METIIMVAQLLLALSFIVAIHEWGHMFAAKRFGMRVEKYSIGFPPKIWSKTIGETEYSIGAIPLGGFVKISGMLDESMDKESLKAEPQSWEFRAKPAWQRLVVMMGGIIMNIISGVIIFICLAFFNGDVYLSKENLNKNGIVASEKGEALGFKTGDKILKINDKEFSSFSEALKFYQIENYEIERESQEMTLEMPTNMLDIISDNPKQDVIRPLRPFYVKEVTPNSNAEKAGLEKNDYISAINATRVEDFFQFREYLIENTGEEIALEIIRNGAIISMEATVTEEGMLGFVPGINDLDYNYVDYSLGESVAEGTNKAFTAIWLNIVGFKKMIGGEISVRKSLGGPIKIATMFGGVWDWNRFFGLVGLLSMVIAFINFLPIPALDGGHVVFLTWEIITGRKVPDKFLEIAQKVGMVILLTLMAFVIINDTISLF